MSLFSNVPGALKLLLPLAAGGALAGAIALGASRDDPGGSTPPEQLIAATPTTIAERTPPASPRLEPRPPSWDSARPDCPAGWRVYNDPDGYFSVCHAPALLRSAGGRVAGPGAGATFGLDDPDDRSKAVPVNTFSLNVAWRPTPGLGLGLPSPSTCTIYTGQIAKPTHTEYVEQFVDGRLATGCLTEGTLGGDSAFDGKSLLLYLPVSRNGGGNEGYIIFVLSFLGPDFQATLGRVNSILHTVKIR